MTFEELKNRIYEDDKIGFILEQLGCHSIKPEQNKTLFTAGLPDGNNKRSVQVRNNEYLSSNIRSRGVKGDILDLICYINQWHKDSGFNVFKAKLWIMDICGYKDTENYTESIKNPLGWLNRVKKQRSRAKTNICDVPIIPENYINQYICPFESISFLQDGIDTETQYEFGICYDVETDRIVIPIHDLEGYLAGFKGRATLDIDVDNKIKYIYLYPTSQSMLLFNYFRAKEYIEMMDEVIVVESEKGCMQLWSMGVMNCVGLGHKDITPQQIKLLKDLKVSIVLAYDKDIDLEFIKEKYRSIGYHRNIYATYDKHDALKGKESPTDKGFDVWSELYKNKIKVY